MIKNWKRFNENFIDIENDIEGILMDFKDSGFKTHSYEMYDGGINIDISVVKRGFIKLNDDLIDSLLTLIDYLHLNDFRVRIYVDEKRKSIEDFTNYDVYQNVRLLCPNMSNPLYEGSE